MVVTSFKVLSDVPPRLNVQPRKDDVVVSAPVTDTEKANIEEFPSLTLDDLWPAPTTSSVTLVSTAEALRAFVQSLQDVTSDTSLVAAESDVSDVWEGRSAVGIDCEWQPSTSESQQPVALLQVF